jgi:PAS domain-containing protein
MLGNEVELRLRSVIEAAPEPFAVTDGDLRLIEIVTGALRIGPRVEEDEQPGALEGLEHGVRSERPRGNDHYCQHVDAEIPQLRQREVKLDRQDGKQHERGSEIGLLEN